MNSPPALSGITCKLVWQTPVKTIACQISGHVLSASPPFLLTAFSVLWITGCEYISCRFVTVPELTWFWSSPDFTFFLISFSFRVQGFFLPSSPVFCNFDRILYFHNFCCYFYAKVSAIYLRIPGQRQMCELHEAYGCIFSIWNFCKLHDASLWLQAQEKVKINNNG